jgi:hypothetical protein
MPQAPVASAAGVVVFARRSLRRIQPPKSSTTVYAAGITTSDNAVDVIRPPMTATAIGRRKLESPDSPSAIGNMPAPIASVVITTGRARLRQASTSASCWVMPSPSSAITA